ncbi:MAG: hypothetical protein ACREON_13630 [Gemmatimonadaceae bacterium]
MLLRRLPSHHPQHLRDLLLANAPDEPHGADLAAVQPEREVAEHGIGGVGGDAVHDELGAGDAEGQRGALDEQCRDPPAQGAHGRGQEGVAVRVDGVLVGTDRELDEEIRELPREARDLYCG